MILVTGHKGYIGGHIYRTLKSKGYAVRGIDLKQGEDIMGCLPNRDDIEYVFHLAALPRVEFSVLRPSWSLRQNVLATSVLLEWASNNNVKRFIFSSSSACVGSGTGPTSPYGLQKLMSEMECKLYSELYGLDTVCLRYFNAYSEDQPYGGAYTTAIAAWKEKIRQSKPLRMDGDGEQTRDLVHVEDIVSANLLMMNQDNNLNGKVFNVGSGTSVSMNYIKEYIDRHHKVEWTHAPARAGDARHTLADISELQNIGWGPRIDIETGLKRCFAS